MFFRTFKNQAEQDDAWNERQFKNSRQKSVRGLKGLIIFIKNHTSALQYTLGLIVLIVLIGQLVTHFLPVTGSLALNTAFITSLLKIVFSLILGFILYFILKRFIPTSNKKQTTVNDRSNKFRPQNIQLKTILKAGIICLFIYLIVYNSWIGIDLFIRQNKDRHTEPIHQTGTIQSITQKRAVIQENRRGLFLSIKLSEPIKDHIWREFQIPRYLAHELKKRYGVNRFYQNTFLNPVNIEVEYYPNTNILKSYKIES